MSQQDAKSKTRRFRTKTSMVIREYDPFFSSLARLVIFVVCEEGYLPVSWRCPSTTAPNRIAA
jgi:hypothetical protein